MEFRRLSGERSLPAVKGAIRCAGTPCGLNMEKGDANKILFPQDPKRDSALERHVPGHPPLDGGAHRSGGPGVVVVPAASKTAAPAPADSRPLRHLRLRSPRVATGGALSG